MEPKQPRIETSPTKMLNTICDLGKEITDLKADNKALRECLDTVKKILRIDELEAENKALTARLESIQKLVNKQAEDEGIFFQAVYVTEAFLQSALRELHTLIEDGE